MLTIKEKNFNHYYIVTKIINALNLINLYVEILMNYTQ